MLLLSWNISARISFGDILEDDTNNHTSSHEWENEQYDSGSDESYQEDYGQSSEENSEQTGEEEEDDASSASPEEEPIIPGIYDVLDQHKLYNAFLPPHEKEAFEPSNPQEMFEETPLDPISLSNIKTVPGEVIIKFKSGEKAQAISQAISDNLHYETETTMEETLVLERMWDVHEIDCIAPIHEPSFEEGQGLPLDPTQENPTKDTYVLSFSEDTDTDTLIKSISEDPELEIEWIEPNVYLSICDFTPNDTYYNTEETWGQSYKDQWPLHSIQAQEGWAKFSSESDIGKDVVVAVIDTGVDYNHPDMTGNMWYNPGETPDNNEDDDENGYIDDYRGWNFSGNNNNPMDDHLHGTHVAGTIAAVTDNNTGIAGLSWHTKIMPLKGLSASGNGKLTDLADALYYAADNGADVINCSWGGFGYWHTIEDAVNYAHSKGCVVVAAAGNSNLEAKNSARQI